jgi:GAF domain-containing protein
VNDASTHPLVRDNPAVTERGVLAYAGVPVSGQDGLPIGALAVVEDHPRDWTTGDVKLLRDLANILGGELELREMKRGPVTSKKARRRRAR